MVPALVQLALDYYRTPLRYDHLSDMDMPLPRGFETLLDEMGHALAGPRIDETAGLVSIAPRELLQAARFFVRHALLHPAGDYYRWLGVSRTASPETIRHHYLLLMRMFHPDRAPDLDQAELAYASRINAAYRVLHDPQARRAYDLSQPSAVREQRPSDPRLFFRASSPVILSKRGGRLARLRRAIAGRPVVVATAIMACFGLGYLIIQEAHVEPTLRVTADGDEARGDALPHYLQSQPSREPDAGRDAVGELPAPPTASKTAMSPSAVGSQVLASLEEAYRRGDAGAFASLFTPDARINDGGGQTSIQRTYAAFLARSASGRLSLTDVEWRAGPDGRIVGRSRVAISDMDDDASGSRASGGRIDLELVPVADGYRVSRLHYQLD